MMCRARGNGGASAVRTDYAAATRKMAGCTASTEHEKGALLEVRGLDMRTNDVESRMDPPVALPQRAGD